MNSDRIKLLEQYITDDPDDPFNHYALGLELSKTDKPKAKKIFDDLISKKPEYVPTYYQAALVCLELSLTEQAVVIINQGIIKAKEQTNLKAANELRSLLDELE
ncbi:hypothetical protein WSM22_42480 [Cytophagales bacterium WSM2-2]|nr:hypothetical protein WSM22_42480 [Cytophagales bacterium WSM2-2]